MPMTPEEIERMLTAHDRILHSDNGRFVRRDTYDLTHKHIAKDLDEINETLKWAMRLVVGQFVALLVGLVVMAVVSLT